MDTHKLKAYMVLKGDSQEKLAEHIGRSRSRLNAKINRTNDAELTLSEMEAIAARYELSPEEAGRLCLGCGVS